MTTPDTATTTAFYWVLIRCTCGLFHHYRPTDDPTVLVCTRTGGYVGCGLTIRLTDVSPPATGDTIAIEGGALHYGIDPAATFVYRTINSEFGWPRTFTAAELADYLFHICVWQQFTISEALIEAARDGIYEHESGYGLKTRITREGHPAARRAHGTTR